MFHLRLRSSRALLAVFLGTLFLLSTAAGAQVADLPATTRVVVTGSATPTSIFLAPGKVWMDCWAQNYDAVPHSVDITTTQNGAALGPPIVEVVLDPTATPNTTGKDSYRSLGKPFVMRQGEELFASIPVGAVVLVGCNVSNP